MKEFLESLEIGEGKVKLSQEEIKSILTENGKIITNEVKKVTDSKDEEIKTYKTTIDDLNEQLKNVPSTDEIDNLKKTISDLQEAEKTRIAEEKAKQEDEILTKNITDVFGEKKFTSDYARNGLIADIKSELSKTENKGKGISEIFESLTKDKEGIFESDNKIPEIPGFGTQNPNLTEDDFVDKVMGLK